MQVDTIKPKLKAPETKRLKLKYVELLSSFAFNFNLRRYNEEDCLTDLYVGTARASFLDLSAGPFTWGPLVGGQGLRGPLDTPDVDLRFG